MLGGSLRGAINAPCSFFLAADVGDFLENVVHRAGVDYISRGDFVLELPAQAAQPHIYSFVKRELRFAGMVVLYDRTSQC
jgi:hypothetical protein